ncbi:hypothetical protein SISNIDRAFT_273751 [Sistotremastrum niveocremeum HHB9708]|uniref:Hemerythrin-like domain-containing protein n=2 Tax=Sistotremastraceae TaxID=3402574 RepID=A0A164NVX4_9AGAM|nr:hypothetical protein SISNIDRAFT_273751 [Sistotremastrum niveocremeum HHB9708]KZT40480.1 hypothetical protein SISSUDRAFT_1070200 [Sistotremastrum suecicum HHB10207 ss-3]
MSSKALTQTIVNDHHEMYEYHDKYIRAAGDKATQEMWGRQITWEVATHVVAEEIVVFPLIEKHLGSEGTASTNKHLEQHREIKTLLRHLADFHPSTPQYDQVLEDLMKNLRAHNEEEEAKNLPALEAEMTSEQSLSAAKAFQRKRHFVPTRAHPNSSQSHGGRFETVAAFLEAPWDKLKDQWVPFPTTEMIAVP